MGSVAVHETEGVVRMIQIEMEMPKNCMDCPACNEYLMCAIPCDGRGWGENDVKDFSQSRPEWCPMKEQEAIMIKTVMINGSGRNGRCQNCLMMLNEMDYPNFCGNCGQAVKWE